FGIDLPGFKYDKLRTLARSLERMSGIPVQPTEPGIGLDVFSHESGIHTAGLLIHPAIYQFIPPSDLGAEITYVYGKHSGALVIEHALRHAGIAPEPELVAKVLAEVKRIREERRRVALVAAAAGALGGIGFLGVSDAMGFLRDFAFVRADALFWGLMFLLLAAVAMAWWESRLTVRQGVGPAVAGGALGVAL